MFKKAQIAAAVLGLAATSAFAGGFGNYSYNYSDSYNDGEVTIEKDVVETEDGKTITTEKKVSNPYYQGSYTSEVSVTETGKDITVTKVINGQTFTYTKHINFYN